MTDRKYRCLFRKRYIYILLMYTSFYSYNDWIEIFSHVSVALLRIIDDIHIKDRKCRLSCITEMTAFSESY